MHGYRFFELAGTQAIEFEFNVTVDEADTLPKRVREAEIRVFYARDPATFGVIGPRRPEDLA